MCPRILKVIPVDTPNRAAHQRAQQTQDGPRRQRWHSGHHRSNGNGQQEANTSGQGCQACRRYRNWLVTWGVVHSDMRQPQELGAYNHQGS